mmetsp:Transcript_82418/g.123692  ORF Transcript_82418/g.123692 Transcript_82418/m.123692 type:complete len:234 (+) Transcript_82418:50-751(+)
MSANTQEIDTSASFYAFHSERYAEVAHQYLQSNYIEKSHPALTGDVALQERLKELVPPKCSGLDAGCGAGARDVFKLWSCGYDMQGIDAIPENIQTAIRWHPELQSRVSVHNMCKPLPFETAKFDFVTCNAVIQHIDPPTVFKVVLPELVRVLKRKGVLQLMFKNGDGIETLFDKDYDVNRSFQLYKEADILSALEKAGMELIEGKDEKLGGIMTFVDPKKIQSLCLLPSQSG